MYYNFDKAKPVSCATSRYLYVALAVHAFLMLRGTDAGTANAKDRQWAGPERRLRRFLRRATGHATRAVHRRCVADLGHARTGLQGGSQRRGRVFTHSASRVTSSCRVRLGWISAEDRLGSPHRPCGLQPGANKHLIYRPLHGEGGPVKLLTTGQGAVLLAVGFS